MEDIEVTYIPVMLDYYEEYDELTDEEFGRLIRAGLLRAKTGEVTAPAGNERYVAKSFYNDIDHHVANYMTKVKNGRKGGRPAKTEANLEEPNETEQNLTKPNKTEVNLEEPSLTEKNEEEIEIETKNKTKSNLEKKTKAKKENPFFAIVAADKELSSALHEFAEFRTRIKAPMTGRAKEMLCDKLQTFPREQWIPILHQSIYNGWKDIYALKSNATGGVRSGKQMQTGYPMQEQPRDAEQDLARYDAILAQMGVT